MPEQRLVGNTAAPGFVEGRVSVLERTRGAGRRAGSKAEEWRMLLDAVDRALTETRTRAGQAGADAADMFAFQLAMLADEALVGPALDAVAAGATAPDAWQSHLDAEAAAYARTGDAVLTARTADLADIRDRVLAHLVPWSATELPLPGAVIAATDLPLSRFLDIDWSDGGAVVLTCGSPASHVAMLARARGVPMVVGVGAPLAEFAGRMALVDATAGEVVIDPSDATVARFVARRRDAAEARASAADFRGRLAMTADGTRIAVAVNVGSVAELERLDPAVCDGIGLVRTEFLFRDATDLSDEQGQFAAYRRILDWSCGRPVVVRTLDAGGDKPIPGVTPSGESNPFLGLRGLRLSLRSLPLFRTQLRALARAAAHGDLRILLPMVTVPAEFDAARDLLDAVVGELKSESVPARRPALGMMVEVPAAAITIHRFAAEFLSIGSNDLVQYITAAGRDIGAVAELADPLNPAVLSLIGSVARHGRRTGCDVSLCGDAAADPRCIEALLMSGVRSLSVAPEALGAVKMAIAAVRVA